MTETTQGAARPGAGGGALDAAMRAFDEILDEFRDHVRHGSNIIGDKLERALREAFAEQVAARQEAEAAVERLHTAGTALALCVRLVDRPGVLLNWRDREALRQNADEWDAAAFRALGRALAAPPAPAPTGEAVPRA